ncbi:hypothetical protein Tco_1335350 [Tanacetum coccineum]
MGSTINVADEAGGSLSSHSFALPFRVKWKNQSLDASFVAPSACMLSTMLRKSLRCWKGFSLSKPWNLQKLWINQISREFTIVPVYSLGRTIEFWNPDGFGIECSYKFLGASVVCCSILTDDDESSSKRFIEWFCQSLMVLRVMAAV